MNTSSNQSKVNSSQPQIAKVTQPFGIDPPIVHCPICGQSCISEGDNGWSTTPCAHLAFIFVGAANEFEYRSPDFERRMESLVTEGEKEDEEYDESTEDLFAYGEYPKLLQEVGYGDELLTLAISYGGMACGPVWYTDVYGFDYGTLARQEENSEAS